MRSFILFIFLLVSYTGLADSPLTSTPFSDAYADHEMVINIRKNGLDSKAMDYLLSDTGNLVIKIAMINQLQFGQKTYTRQFEEKLKENRKGIKEEAFEFLKEKHHLPIPENKWTKKLTTSDLICFAYLQARGNYFEPGLAITAAELAYNRESKDMAVATVYALITCQIAFDISWCDVYKTGQLFFVRDTYTKNKLNAEALDIILDYLNLYESDCE